MDKVVIENHKKYLERIALYKKFGYEVEKEREFILEKAQPLYGDILEVGTGKGHFAIVLAKEGYKFVSIDISEQEQRIAKLNIKYLGLEKQVDFKIENAEHFTFENGSFDVVFSVNVVHHITNLFKIMDELARIVSFEGKIILSDFTKEGLKVIDKVHKCEGRRHGFTQESLANAEEYLIDKRFIIEKYRSEFQEVLIGYHSVV